jgi:pyruvate/2-oxoglutarate dehydrogenase complex dihydrolipoamide acyltransferase (E2) component
MLTMTLSCDHRVIDGFRAALFLEQLVEALQMRP